MTGLILKLRANQRFHLAGNVSIGANKPVRLDVNGNLPFLRDDYWIDPTGEKQTPYDALQCVLQEEYFNGGEVAAVSSSLDQLSESVGETNEVVRAVKEQLARDNFYQAIRVVSSARKEMG